MLDISAKSHTPTLFFNFVTPGGSAVDLTDVALMAAAVAVRNLEAAEFLLAAGAPLDALVGYESCPFDGGILVSIAIKHSHEGWPVAATGSPQASVDLKTMVGWLCDHGAPVKSGAALWLISTS